MKKVYQEIIISFNVEDEKDVNQVLCDMSVELTDNSGKLEEHNRYIDWEYGEMTMEDI